MNIQTLNDTVTADAALAALREYKQHRAVYDKADWEIERVYRAISKGKVVINALQAIRGAGLDDKGRPRLAICQHHATHCICYNGNGNAVFAIHNGTWQGTGRIRVPWEGPWVNRSVARLPRIPPQHRPAKWGNYHILWEADWEDLPVDPYLLRRIGRDAWVVLAAWDLTQVELSVLRSRGGGQ